MTEQDASTKKIEPDFGPSERAFHDRVIYEKIEGPSQGYQARARVHRVEYLEKYQRKGKLSDRETHAGARYRILRHQSEGSQHLTSSYDELIGGGSVVDYFSGIYDAGSELIKVDRALGKYFNEVIRVCHRNEPTKNIRTLRRGLAILADFWGF
jgi:hypothetical protein|tara:strand:- start:123 stop:584 length:462 start_codon:yes stop_codon:yes gene_type:complete